MFSRRLRSVVPMSPSQLAQDDGSAMSAGRGSGLEKSGGSSTPQRIPFMQMTFAPLERRLDVAIFRAMFASSTRQARQFVVHGHVTVNGKKVWQDSPSLDSISCADISKDEISWLPS